MSRYQIETELFKGEEPIDFPMDFDDDEIDSALMGTRLALERGDADNVVIYVSKGDELLGLVTETRDSFDAKTVTEKIESYRDSDGE